MRVHLARVDLRSVCTPTIYARALYGDSRTWWRGMKTLGTWIELHARRLFHKSLHLRSLTILFFNTFSYLKKTTFDFQLAVFLPSESSELALVKPDEYAWRAGGLKTGVCRKELGAHSNYTQNVRAYQIGSDHCIIREWRRRWEKRDTGEHMSHAWKRGVCTAQSMGVGHT